MDPVRNEKKVGTPVGLTVTCVNEQSASAVILSGILHKANSKRVTKPSIYELNPKKPLDQARAKLFHKRPRLFFCLRGLIWLGRFLCHVSSELIL